MMCEVSAGGLDMVYVCAGWKHAFPHSIAGWEQHLSTNTANPQQFPGIYGNSCNHELLSICTWRVAAPCLPDLVSSQSEDVCTRAPVLLPEQLVALHVNLHPGCFFSVDCGHCPTQPAAGSLLCQEEGLNVQVTRIFP